MVLRFVLVLMGMLILAACGGRAVDPLTAPDRVIFQSDTLLLTGQDFTVYARDKNYNLASPNFVDGFAQYRSTDQSYYAVNQGDVLVVAGQMKGHTFDAVAGELAEIMSYDQVVFDAEVQFTQGAYSSRIPVDISVNFGWNVPRILGGDPQIGLDISGQVYGKGVITGSVSSRLGQTVQNAPMKGRVGISENTGMVQISAGFSGNDFYGVFYGVAE